MKKHKLICTFGIFGTKQRVKEILSDKKEIIFEHSESVGKSDECHHGVFVDYIGMDKNDILIDEMKNYFYHNPVSDGECFDLSYNGVKILTEESL